MSKRPPHTAKHVGKGGTHFQIGFAVGGGCLEFINRVDLERGAIISPKDLENQLEQSALDLNSLVSLVEDESKDMKNMANEFLELVSIVRAQHEALEDVRSLEKIINSNKLVEKVEVVKKVIGSRQAMIEKLIFEDF